MAQIQEVFYAQFFLINVVTETINKLKEIIYYQKSYIVEHYLDKFQFILEASYTDPYAIVVVRATKQRL